jgi:hypothetical protein
VPGPIVEITTFAVASPAAPHTIESFLALRTSKGWFTQERSFSSTPNAHRTQATPLDRVRQTMDGIFVLQSQAFPEKTGASRSVVSSMHCTINIDGAPMCTKAIPVLEQKCASNDAGCTLAGLLPIDSGAPPR